MKRTLFQQHLTRKGNDMDTPGFEIKEIIPVTGWRAVFKVNNGFFTEPVGAWGLVEDEEGSQRVMGFVADGPELRPAPENVLFHSYCSESEAIRYLEDLKEGRLSA